MASSTLKHRSKQPNDVPNTTDDHQPKSTSPKPQRALKSLTLFILIPLALTSFSIFIFGSGATSSLYFPPLWLIHLAQLASSALIGFAAWFVWVDGGFGRRSGGDALALYVSHMALCVTWEPLVLGTGAAAIGFVFSAVNFATVVAVYGEFRKVNAVAGQLVKPCMAWTAILTFVTFKLIAASKPLD